MPWVPPDSAVPNCVFWFLSDALLDVALRFQDLKSRFAQAKQQAKPLQPSSGSGSTAHTGPSPFVQHAPNPYALSPFAPTAPQHPRPRPLVRRTHQLGAHFGGNYADVSRIPLVGTLSGVLV